jgi:Homeodomain-like domain
MTDEPSSLSERAEARAAAKARRAKRIERREALLDLVASGYSHRQIATAMGVSLATVRREVDKALAERPIHAPEHYVSLQVARLTKALSYADLKLERGDIRAFGPYMKVLAALDRYHGFDGRLGLPRATQTGSAVIAPPPLALTHVAEPAVLPSEVAQFGAQDLEIVGAPVDIAGSAERDGNPPLALAHAEPALPPLPSELAQSGAPEVEFARAPIEIAGLLGRDGEPPVALTHPELAPPPLAPEVARFGARDIEIARAPIDVARLVG